MSYVSVRNLERYQHYKNRRPVWIKLHLKVLDDDDFAGLSVPARLVFLLSLLLAASRDNRIPADANWMAVELRMPRPVIAKALAELLAREYLVPLATEREGEKEGDRETEQQRTTTDIRTLGGAADEC